MSHYHLRNAMANERVSNELEEGVKDLMHDYACLAEENVQLSIEIQFLQDQNRRLEEERNKMKEQLVVIGETIARVL
jgi:hypothetical protein